MSEAFPEFRTKICPKINLSEVLHVNARIFESYALKFTLCNGKALIKFTSKTAEHPYNSVEH